MATTTLNSFPSSNGGRFYTTEKIGPAESAETWDLVKLIVTPGGHWYRSDDPRDELHNDTVCRGCQHFGHFDYILDRLRCPNWPRDTDIAAALAEPPLTQPLVGVDRWAEKVHGAGCLDEERS